MSDESWSGAVEPPRETDPVLLSLVIPLLPEQRHRPSYLTTTTTTTSTIFEPQKKSVFQNLMVNL